MDPNLTNNGHISRNTPTAYASAGPVPPLGLPSTFPLARARSSRAFVRSERRCDSVLAEGLSQSRQPSGPLRRYSVGQWCWQTLDE